MDLRERVLADCDAGLPTQQVALKYRVSPAWVRRLKQRRRQTGAIAPRPPRNHRPPALAPYRDRMRQLIAATPDLTLRELRDRLGVAVSLSTLWAAVPDLGLTVKKKSPGPPSRTGPT
jgi:transposase